MQLQVPRDALSLKQRVINRLRDAIVNGEFSPGQKLVEKDLCNRLEVSRPLLREALQWLEAEGLVSHVPHKGPAVSALSRQDAVDIYAVREALEPLACEGFAMHAVTDQMHDLRDCLTTLKAQAQYPAEDLLETKSRFYRILFEGCGNAVIANILTQLNNRISVLRRLSMSQPGRVDYSVIELERIVAAIEQRDAPLARRLCHDHIKAAATAALKAFDYNR